VTITTIECRFPGDLQARLNDNEVLANVRVLERLRQKGVPVLGAISVRGVANGELSVRTEEDLDGDETVYKWTGEPVDDEL
jgi:hypothetical protein